MRVVFMGSPEFAVPSLKALAGAHDVVAVYTQPDRARRRGKELSPTPVKQAAIELDIPVFQPVSLRADDDEVAALAALEPDVICVAAYGLILPVAVLEIPPLGSVNVHASLLPRHRGAAPIHRAILDGDLETGVSIMRMEEGLDTGPYAAMVRVPVDDHDLHSLTALLAGVGATALLEVLSLLESGAVEWVAQNDADATYANKITDADLALDPSLSVKALARRVRAADGSARAKASVCGRRLDITRAVRDETAVLGRGEVGVTDAGLLLGCADGVLLALEVRPEGKPTMEAAAFARGARLEPGCSWSGV